MVHVLGSFLLSQDPSVQVPSALEGLTVVFGMGTRGTPPPSPPNGFSARITSRNLFRKITDCRKIFRFRFQHRQMLKANRRLTQPRGLVKFRSCSLKTGSKRNIASCPYPVFRGPRKVLGVLFEASASLFGVCLWGPRKVLGIGFVSVFLTLWGSLG